MDVAQRPEERPVEPICKGIFNNVNRYVQEGYKYEGIVLYGEYGPAFLERLRSGVQDQFRANDLDIPTFVFRDRAEFKDFKFGDGGYYAIDLNWLLDDKKASEVTSGSPH